MHRIEEEVGAVDYDRGGAHALHHQQRDAIPACCLIVHMHYRKILAYVRAPDPSLAEDAQATWSQSMCEAVALLEKHDAMPYLNAVGSRVK